MIRGRLDDGDTPFPALVIAQDEDNLLNQIKLEKPDVVELMTQIGLRNAQELKLLIEDTDNIPDVAQRFHKFYQENPLAKDTLALLFENYPFIPESTQDLISILQKAKQIFRYFKH